MGFIAASCLSVSGGLSGSLSAAAVMAASSRAVGGFNLERLFITAVVASVFGGIKDNVHLHLLYVHLINNAALHLTLDACQ